MAKTKTTTIKTSHMNGSSKGINKHYHYKVLLKNGRVLHIETNEDVIGDKFHIGTGESKQTVWHPDIASVVADFLRNEPEVKKADTKPSPIISKFIPSEGILTINSQYDYVNVSPTIKNRAERIIRGDSPHRVWTFLKPFAKPKEI